MKIITNAGGLDPNSCKNAIEQTAINLGISPPPKVAAIYGDDITFKIDQLISDEALLPFNHLTDEFKSPLDEENLPKNKSILSFNAYIGAFPIAEALRQGAQIIVTGRVVDSALVLGPLIYEFGWTTTDYDLLAAGSLAGHIIE